MAIYLRVGWRFSTQAWRLREQYGSVKVSQVVIPAQAGIQWALVVAGRWIRRLDSLLRGNDENLIAVCR